MPTILEDLRRAVLASQQPTPYTLFSVEAALHAYRQLTDCLPAEVWFAVKAAPLPALLSALAHCGSGADAASPAEVEMSLMAGVPADRISYGNPVRSPAEIEQVAALGVRTWVVDTPLEVKRLAAMAPGARIVIRLAHSGEGADWPLSYRFGCTPHEARRLAHEADRRGLEVTGLCWHVGSQQCDLGAWDAPLADAATLWGELEDDGIALQLLNLGGGVPVSCYRKAAPPVEDVAGAILAAIDRHFTDRPRLVLEPGRALTAAAGATLVQVKAIADRADGRRYVFLDAGLFSLGLIETVGSAVEYRIEALDHPIEASTRPSVITGPTCDSFDTLPTTYRLPRNLRVGDRLVIWGTGAYTWPYAAQNFNGHRPAPVLLAP
ncbi:alanine racemase [Streptomyces sp. NPDC051172]|uniref:alanine racemase n=1 Tax=Streptomyces sp. NPDC051172 TaxID=3155796 RepID=UPI0034369283